MNVTAPELVMVNPVSTQPDKVQGAKKARPCWSEL